MAQAKFRYHQLDTKTADQLGLDPLPFPARPGPSRSIFKKAGVDLLKLLEELETYVEQFPEDLTYYENNLIKLAGIIASKSMKDGDFQQALRAAGVGLRVSPLSNILRLKQAVSLHSLGHNELAALEYEAILDFEPYAYDPAIRALAAKAWMAADDPVRGLWLLEKMAEPMFADEGLSKLRRHLIDLVEAKNALTEETAAAEGSKEQEAEQAVAERTEPNPEEAQSSRPETIKDIDCPSCGHSNPASNKFCGECGTALHAQKDHCSNCGAQLAEHHKFCTRCGTPRATS